MINKDFVTTTIKVHFFIIALMISACNHKANREQRIDEWAIYEFQYRGNDLLADKKKKIIYQPFPLYIDYDNHLLILDFEGRVKGKFSSFHKKNEYYFMSLESSNDERLIGEYIIKIDTVSISEKKAKIQIIMESEDTYILGYKSIYKAVL